jgi:hypothetical protein
MDIDHIFVGIHVRVLSLLAKYLNPLIRRIILFLSLFYGLIIFSSLIWLHFQHVHISPKHQSFLSPIPASCLPDIKSFMQINNAKIVEIIIQGPNWAEKHQQQMQSDALNKILNDPQYSNQQIEGEITGAGAAEIHIPPSKLIGMKLVDYSNSDTVIYEYGRERGFFTVSKRSLAEHNIVTIQYPISYNHSCFGPFVLPYITYEYVGYDTILLNQLIQQFGYRGYLRNKQTLDMYALNHLNEEDSNAENSYSTNHSSSDPFTPAKPHTHWINFDYTPLEWLQFFVYKIELFITVLFLFFSVTTIVSLTLTQTQIRMLNFTDALRSSLRLSAPIFGLVLEHLVQSLSFVPVIIGILFFLFEFFGDQMLAFLLLLIVWLCESYTVIFVRVSQSMLYFPKLFAIYFMCFGLYFFNFPYGFHYLALFSMYAVLQFFMCFYLFEYEIPAVLNNEITVHRPRMLVLRRRGNTASMRNMNTINNSAPMNLTTATLNIEQDRLRMQQQTERLMRLMFQFNNNNHLINPLQAINTMAGLAELQRQQSASETNQILNSERINNSAAINNTSQNSNPLRVSTSIPASPSVAAVSPTLVNSAVANESNTSRALTALRELPETLSTMITNAQQYRTLAAEEESVATSPPPPPPAAVAASTRPPASPSDPTPSIPTATTQQHQQQLTHLRTHIFEQLAHALQVSQYVLNTILYGHNPVNVANSATSASAPRSPNLTSSNTNAIPLINYIRNLHNQLENIQTSYANSAHAPNHSSSSPRVNNTNPLLNSPQSAKLTAAKPVNQFSPHNRQLSGDNLYIPTTAPSSSNRVLNFTSVRTAQSSSNSNRGSVSSSPMLSSSSPPLRGVPVPNIHLSSVDREEFTSLLAQPHGLIREASSFDDYMSYEEPAATASTNPHTNSCVEEHKQQPR